MILNSIEYYCTHIVKKRVCYVYRVKYLFVERYHIAQFLKKKLNYYVWLELREANQIKIFMCVTFRLFIIIINNEIYKKNLHKY